MADSQPHFDDRARAWRLPPEQVDCEVDGHVIRLPVADLDCTTGGHDTDDEWCSWVEYRRPGNDEPVHRSVRLHLKKATGPLGAAQAAFS